MSAYKIKGCCKNWEADKNLAVWMWRIVPLITSIKSVESLILTQYNIHVTHSCNAVKTNGKRADVYLLLFCF